MTRGTFDHAMVMVLAALVSVLGLGCCPSCHPGYISPTSYPLPAGDCVLTLVGRQNDAIYDCPPLQGSATLGCTAEGGAPSPVAGRYADPAPDEGSSLRLSSLDLEGAPTASDLKSWLGGSTFSIEVVCNGATVVDVESQTIGSICAD